VPKLILAAASPLDLSSVAGWRAELGVAGVDELQVNVRDDAVAGALTIQHLEQPIETVVSTSGGVEADILRILSDHTDNLVGWEVEEREPLPPPPVPDGLRTDALANLAFIRKPREAPYDAWVQHWHGPQVDAIVEELFPMAAIADMHAFYGSGGDDDELSRRITTLMESVAVLGADRDIDLVPTSRYVWRLGQAPT